MQRLETWISLGIASLLLPAVLGLLPGGCNQAGVDLQLCGEIPAGGCPIGRGGTCADQACSALYDCVDGAWKETQACTVLDGGSDVSDAETPDAAADGCTQVVIDHTGETTGCKPDLQNPDCPAVAAEQCAETACLTDCIDFYLCRQDGWILVAYCNEKGQVVLTP
jgi:hypothetical protein